MNIRNTHLMIFFRFVIITLFYSTFILLDLEISLLLLVFILYIIINKNKKKSWSWLHIIYSAFYFFFLKLTLLLFVVDFYFIPSDSMKPSLKAGDKVIVNKLSYGARLSKSKPFYGIFRKSDVTADEFSFINKSFRLPGLNLIKRNDIIVFNNPIDVSKTYIKRIIGLSGENILITKNCIAIATLKDSSNIKMLKPTSNTGLEQHLKLDFSSYPLSDVADNKEVLKTYDFFKVKCFNTEVAKDSTVTINTQLYKEKISLSWSNSNWGPLEIPSKGTTVKLNKTNLIFYKYILKNYESVKFEEINNRYYVNETQIGYYTFKNNYYFLIGDNWTNSLDSRNWGLVPEKNVIGKVEGILFNL